ncbi:hypothetical protein M758_6G162800 [Ceratodon purpureus]|uniref:Uncharacterized protein n=1 Tax=Ceratodon purpureus TaxID=3225 RepID=A0A8T0HFY3_CERPU|nr:hypothetical protein KC19_6G169200 [Ceratodon purpureus]KAG0614259.1 hypothetical protein M758_6G162800 [Ceratodon purpureus]
MKRLSSTQTLPPKPPFCTSKAQYNPKTPPRNFSSSTTYSSPQPDQLHPKLKPPLHSTAPQHSTADFNPGSTFNSKMGLVGMIAWHARELLTLHSLIKLPQVAITLPSYCSKPCKYNRSQHPKPSPIVIY